MAFFGQYYRFSSMLFNVYSEPEARMRKRGRMSRGHSRHVFRKGAQNVHPKNSLQTTGPMRGGIRL